MDPTPSGAVHIDVTLNLNASSGEAEGSSVAANGNGSFDYDMVGDESPGPVSTDYRNGSPVPNERKSMYVTLFDEMIHAVLESESHLFTPRELWILRYILELPYEAHYLFVRLLLRRPGKVHPISSIEHAYSAEIGQEGVQRAARALCVPLGIPEEIVEADPPPVVRLLDTNLPCKPTILSLSTDDLKPRSTEVKPTSSRRNSRPWASLSTGLTKQEEEADPDLAETIRISLWQEQNPNFKDDSGYEVDSGNSDFEILDEPCRAGPSRSDSTASLPFPPVSNISSLSSDIPMPTNSLCHDESELTLDHVMSCVPAEDLRRVARKRKIPSNMLVTRDSTMKALRDSARRQTVLGFAPLKDRKGKGKATNGSMTALTNSNSERHVMAELMPFLGDHVIQVDQELNTLISRVNLVYSRTPPQSAYCPALILPPILVTSHKRSYPDYGPPTRSTIWETRGEMLSWEQAVHWDALVTEAWGDTWVEQRRNGGPSGWSSWNSQQMIPRPEAAKIVRGVWDRVWPIWQEMVKGDGGLPVAPDQLRGGLAGDRFQSGHVLTRIIAKGCEALAILHEYDVECKTLRALLAQRRWRRNKRGAWYDRLALILMNHFKGSVEEKTAKLEEATQVCIDGLLDEDTHLIYRPALSRRLSRLENRLNLPPEERHISYAQLLECETRELVAPRVQQNAGQVRVEPVQRGEREPSPEVGDDRNPRVLPQQVGKSVWMGREGEVTVEGWVLEWWEAQGYQGFHAEGSILTTLFALLMWPILFYPLPGAFETKYQTAPLDLGEDTFARARRSLIDERLAAMQNTESALEMLRETDSRERPRGTWAVGLNWDYGARELEEIVLCLGGRGLAMICRMLSEEYSTRISGVPDLIVWNMDQKVARFVEVKGPGDQLSEKQKIWIDVLLSSGIPVEVCKVKAQDSGGKDDSSTDDLSKPTRRMAGLKRKSSALVQSTTTQDKKGTLFRNKSAPECIVILDSDDETRDDTQEEEFDLEELSGRRFRGKRGRR